jgi:hypothetical protein
MTRCVTLRRLTTVKRRLIRWRPASVEGPLICDTPPTVDQTDVGQFWYARLGLMVASFLSDNVDILNGRCP